MQIAKEVAEQLSLDEAHKTGAVIVKNEKVLGFGWNGSAIHEIKGYCERKKRNMPSGQGYELCAGCHGHFHAERRAIRMAMNNNENLENSEMYLWGHWWCCETCEKHITHYGISKVYLVENAKGLFGRLR